ncbi:hypothetical protein ACIPSE_16660 [Streptomyces sp. NPDC090106]|uniref:hypothetical protein n=1 Tax=Streptomyces sp. NPDC090106 TaxID=3365946 RepID=UPI0037FB96DB
MSTRTWLRAFVLLLALLMPGAHTGAHAVASPVVAGEAAEYDALDTVVRPVHRTDPRPAVPLRPALPAPAPLVPVTRPLPAPPDPSYAPRFLRSVVLRC